MTHEGLLPEDTQLNARRLRLQWGGAISAQRKALGMTQEQLADAVGVTPQAVGAWERGETAPRAQHQPLIARALGVAWQVLFQPEAVGS